LKFALDGCVDDAVALRAIVAALDRAGFAVTSKAAVEVEVGTRPFEKLFAGLTTYATDEPDLHPPWRRAATTEIGLDLLKHGKVERQPVFCEDEHLRVLLCPLRELDAVTGGPKQPVQLGEHEYVPLVGLLLVQPRTEIGPFEWIDRGRHSEVG
jgi:hypothetical protein